MAILTITGSASGAGKTAVACALIAALPQLRWIGVKVTPHDHTGPEDDPEDEAFSKDTGRYSAAGAEWTALIAGYGKASVERLLTTFRPWPNQTSLLVESNQVDTATIAQPGEPTLTLAVLAGPFESWKPSLPARLPGVDAAILACGLTPASLPPDMRQKPCFRLPDGQWSTPELVEFVRGRLSV